MPIIRFSQLDIDQLGGLVFVGTDQGCKLFLFRDLARLRDRPIGGCNDLLLYVTTFFSIH